MQCFLQFWNLYPLNVIKSPFILFFSEDKIDAVNQTREMEQSTLVCSGLFDEEKSFWQEEHQGKIIAPLIFIFPLPAEERRLLKCTCLYHSIVGSSAQLVGTCQELFAWRGGIFLFTFYYCIVFSVFFSVQNPSAAVLQHHFCCFALCLKPIGEGKLQVTPKLSNLLWPSRGR